MNFQPHTSAYTLANNSWCKCAKKRCKKITVRAFGSGNGKVIFTLQTKVITFQVRLIIITSGNSAFNSCLRGPSEEGTWASKIVLRIFCRFLSTYLAIKDFKGPIIGSSELSLLEFWKIEDFEGSLEMRSLWERLQS